MLISPHPPETLSLAPSQIYSMTGNGSFDLAYEIRGLTKTIITVPGPQILLHFIAADASPLGEGFYLAWSMTPSAAAKESRCGNPKSVALSACLPGAPPLACLC